MGQGPVARVVQLYLVVIQEGALCMARSVLARLGHGCSKPTLYTLLSRMQQTCCKQRTSALAPSRENEVYLPRKLRMACLPTCHGNAAGWTSEQPSQTPSPISSRSASCATSAVLGVHSAGFSCDFCVFHAFPCRGR